VIVIDERAEWSHTEEHMLERHGVTAVMANEALADAGRVEYDPDYNSRSGVTSRVIGYSATAGRVLSVIVFVDEGGRTIGVNGWAANSRDRRTYMEGREDD